MGHQISAMIARAPLAVEAARKLDLPVFEPQDAEGKVFVIVALSAEHVDHWTETLGLAFGAGASAILLDCPVTHEFARLLGMDRHALIETNYFGGRGQQFAAVYRVGVVEMPATEGGINAALSLLGVTCRDGMDAFDSIGLGRHRSFDALFEKYWR